MIYLNVIAEQYGYSLTFDNVNQKTHVRHSTREKTNTMYNMVQAYAARNRIPTWHLSDAEPSIEEIGNIPLDCYFPSTQDDSELK